MLKAEVYDIETLYNLFTYTSYVVEDDKWYSFVIHEDRNDFIDLCKHLIRGGFFQVGFNNNSFDYPVIHHLLKNYKNYKFLSGSQIANSLYNEAQRLINSQEYHGIPDNNKYIFQLDLFKIWHFDNKARRTSLKDLEFAMNMDVQEMPIHHNQYCKKENINTVLSYNRLDVETTVKFYLTSLGKTDYSVYKGKNKLALRTSFKNMFNIPCYNWPDVKIGEQLMLTLYCRETNSDISYIKNLRTNREIIHLKDCIPYWCDIKSKEFKEFYNLLEITSIKPGSKDFSKTVIYHGIGFDFALGGCHGCIKQGVYKSDNQWVILDLDINSLYPSIAKSLNLYPEHLGQSFNNLYTQFIDVRIKEKHKPKNERNNALIEGYKLLLNGTYGKSGEETSFLYDPLYTYKTTIAGQCFICMWAERMVEVCPELIFIQINTKLPLVF